MISVVKDGVLTAQQPLWTSGAILLLGSGLLAGGILWRRAQKRAGDATFLRRLRAWVLILVGPMLMFGAFATFTYRLRVGPEGVALHSFGFSTNTRVRDSLGGLWVSRSAVPVSLPAPIL